MRVAAVSAIGFGKLTLVNGLHNEFIDAHADAEDSA
jgi:hypothetical protein